jgi:hypothetical protein
MEPLNTVKCDVVISEFVVFFKQVNLCRYAALNVRIDRQRAREAAAAAAAAEMASFTAEDAGGGDGDAAAGGEDAE